MYARYAVEMLNYRLFNYSTYNYNTQDLQLKRLTILVQHNTFNSKSNDGVA